MPMNKAEYPADWKQISLRIREREGNKCKFCGVPNHTYIVRSTVDPFRWAMDDPETSGCLTFDGNLYKWSEAPDEFQSDKETYIVLTVAHYPDPDKMNCADDNLQALCQRCHLLLDLPHHMANAKVTRRRKKHAAVLATGQLALEDIP